MASVHWVNGRYTVRWRERVHDRVYARWKTCPDEQTANELRSLVEREVVLYGRFRERGPRPLRNRRTTRDDGFVYFIEAAGRIKIGYATDPTKRLAELQCGCPVPMSMMGTLPGTTQDEAAWHARFTGQRLHGEWFEGDDALREAIESAVRGWCVRVEDMGLASGD